MCSTREIVEQLSEGDRQTLEALVKSNAGQSIPLERAEKFLSLGLAELVMGSLDLTGTGRKVLQAIHA